MAPEAEYVPKYFVGSSKCVVTFVGAVAPFVVELFFAAVQLARGCSSGLTFEMT